MVLEVSNRDIFKFFDTDNVEEYLYSPCSGINKYSTVLYCENIHKQVKLFFRLCDKYRLQYVVFAGSSVGLVRNQQMMPWTDDYDIIVMEEHKEFFFKELMPILRSYGFNFWGCGTNKGSKKSRRPGWTFIGGKTFGNACFRVDIFWSKVNSKGIVENVDGQGFYHNKVPYDVFFPVKRQFFNKLYLPFGNDYEKEVLLTYGDVRKECIIKTHKKGMKEIFIHYNHWEDALKDFELLKQYAIQNMKDYIQIEKYKPEDKILQLEYVDYHKIFRYDKEILKYIANNNINTINVQRFWKFQQIAALVKFYFPKIKINLFINSLEDVTNKSSTWSSNSFNYFYLNYATNIYTYNDEIRDHLQSVVYADKTPNIVTAKVITFGTFDLFHKGHENILDNCKNLSENHIVVGVSSDSLNKKKGKQSHDVLEIRKKNVKDYSNCKTVFTEESLEHKLEYIKQYDCNILVMGDDWKNKFNSDKYECIYLNRTQGISSTMLRNNVKVNGNINKTLTILPPNQ